MKRDAIKKEIHELSAVDLHAKIAALRGELFSVRINAATAHVKDYSQFKKLRKSIAQALTHARSGNSAK